MSCALPAPPLTLPLPVPLPQSAMESIWEKSSTTAAAAASFSFCSQFFFLLFLLFSVLVFKIHSPVHVAFVGLVKQTQRTQLLRGSWLSFPFTYIVTLFFGFFIVFWAVFLGPGLVSIGLNASRCNWPRLFDCCCSSSSISSSSVILSYNFIASATLCAVMIFIGTCSWHMTSGIAL